MKGLWPSDIAAFRESHLRSDAHIAILRIAEIESFVLEKFGIEADADDAPVEIRAFVFLSFMRPMADQEQAAKIDVEIERQLASLRKGAH